MLLISMDEGGHFERIQTPQCNLIGGVALECDSEESIKKETRILQRFFSTICQEQGARYPFDLHYNWMDGQVINAEKATRVKSALETELPDFFHQRGRWMSGRGNKAVYSVFCMVGDQNGLDEKNATNLRDNVATVRYDHMIYRTIENLLFYNPRYLDEQKVTLHLPTRVVRISDNEQRMQMRTLGYGRRKNSDGSFDDSTYVVTDETGFRTGLEAALLNSDRTDMTFELSVQTINYQTEQLHQMFLYLADTLCSVYQDAVRGIPSVTKAIPALYECGRKLTGAGRTQLWAYHPLDQRWRTSWRCFMTRNWFAALDTASDIALGRGETEKLYRKMWVSPMEDLMATMKDPASLEASLMALDHYSMNKASRSQDKAWYILDILKRNYAQYQDDERWKTLEYQISKISLGLYNHQGDHYHAMEEYDRCMKAAKYVPVEEFLGLQFNYAVSLNDAFRFAEAEKIASEVVSHHELLKDVKADIFPDHGLIHDSYGRALSQHAQCLAHMRKFDVAIPEFRKAVGIFEKGSDDWWMTGSFLLHALIGAKDEQGYRDFASEYFGASSPLKQFGEIRKGRCGRVSYALYVFLKGLWVFNIFEKEKEMLRMLDTIASMRQTSKEYHPWEQIMKYCAFIRLRLDKDENHDVPDQMMEAGRAAIPSPYGVLKLIMEENERQYLHERDGVDYTADPRIDFVYT